ncbi:hypothetical protein DFJ74DRAFT_685329 [Hyaloraphidium curvatum]|nr:hypothetical protein DFJ74DRAFT_685329 [Hyaloraphidium curvatum]
MARSARSPLFLAAGAAAALLAIALLSVPSVAASSDVIELHKTDFADTIKKEDLILVEFFAPWCGHCSEALAPEYEKAATELKSAGIPIAKVDCTVEEEVCQEQDVKGYPTLKVFRSGSPTDYKGPRKADGIVSYMKKQALPAMSEVTAKNAETFIDSDKVVVVGFFTGADTAEYKALLAVANKLRDDYIFGATVDEEVTAKHGVKSPAVVLFKKFDEGKNVFEGSWTEEDLSKFVVTSATPLMDELGPENYGKYVEAGLPLAYSFYSNDAERKAVAAELESVAKQYKGKLNFVMIDGSKYGAHGKNLGLEESWPAFVIQVHDDNAKYPFDQKQKITAEAIGAFVKDYVEGKLTPHLKTQPEPESQDGPVTVLVGTNFEKLVLDKEKDVFVEFYAPWCGHCKKLAPTWDELGEKYKSVNGVTIAKMDATENDIPSASPFKNIQGFPTLVLFKSGDNEYVQYEGPRTLDSLVEFLETNAK